MAELNPESTQAACEDEPGQRHYFMAAISIGGLLRAVGAPSAKRSEAISLLIEARDQSRLVSQPELIGQLGLADLYRLPRQERTSMDRGRSFLNYAYPKDAVEAVPDGYIQRIFRVLPTIVIDRRAEFAPKTRNMLPRHLQRLEEWLAGEKDIDIAANEYHSRTAVTFGRRNFARALRQVVGFDELLKGALALQEIERS